MPEQPEVTLHEINQDTVIPICKLAVSESQSQFVAPNAISIAQAHFEPKAWFRAIYAGDTPVGFAQMYIDPEKPEYYLWRFMIDVKHQGKGYGRDALRLLIEHVRSLGGKELALSYVPKEGNPAPFYLKLGFFETGEWDEGEKIMRLEL